ncbi:ATP-binding cassette domain-containing protein [Romboutsia maritimum]|uniref:ATP-binding cassette domain-containing protein n=1 Tax=Romboutsia maritimum TaxID=2020948 RepID=A0A371ITD8_9FIRM|nr:ATP-binding cassette domain-containing protein [Romboutsia maritimum]RDY23740.1 ATP-binding cassette domain-containing protein [Romboutsia maritimum]
MDLLSLTNVSFKTNEKNILENINIKINKGDLIFILGHSGSGKSTLLKICANLINQTAGDIFLENKNYYEYFPYDLRREVSYISQESCLFGKTVMDNFEFVYNIRNKMIDYKRINNLLEKFNLNNDYLNKEIHSLSGGEKQRISIIRGILIPPKILLLDEATSALDEKNKLKVEDVILGMKEEGIGIMWVTHDIQQFSRIGSKCIKIESGKLVEEVS